MNRYARREAEFEAPAVLPRRESAAGHSHQIRRDGFGMYGVPEGVVRILQTPRRIAPRKLCPKQWPDLKDPAILKCEAYETPEKLR